MRAHDDAVKNGIGGAKESRTSSDGKFDDFLVRCEGKRLPGVKFDWFRVFKLVTRVPRNRDHSHTRQRRLFRMFPPPKILRAFVFFFIAPPPPAAAAAASAAFSVFFFCRSACSFMCWVTRAPSS